MDRCTSECIEPTAPVGYTFIAMQAIGGGAAVLLGAHWTMPGAAGGLPGCGGVKK